MKHHGGSRRGPARRTGGEQERGRTGQTPPRGDQRHENDSRRPENGAHRPGSGAHRKETGAHRPENGTHRKESATHRGEGESHRGESKEYGRENEAHRRERGANVREGRRKGQERESPGERVARAFGGGGERERAPKALAGAARETAPGARKAGPGARETGQAAREAGRGAGETGPGGREAGRVASDADEGAHVFGVQPVLEALRAGVRPIERLTVAEGAHESRLREILEIARYADIPVRRVPREELQRTAAGANHQGIVATIAAARYTPADELLDALAARVGTDEPPLAVVLDGVEDPRNLGAVIRTVECVGAHGVFIPERRASGLTETVAKAAAGALEYVPVARVANVVRLVEELKRRGVWTIGTAAEAETSYAEWDWTQPCALLLGGEGEGLRRLVRERCDVLVSIPLLGRIESLNVSVAAGVVLYEALRRRTALRAGTYKERGTLKAE
jgi:23S rRNA (guanosine2251-2'-O)-methyltransferase